MTETSVHKDPKASARRAHAHGRPHEVPSLDAMEQLVAMGMEEGMMAALGQIDGLLQAENAPR